MKTKIDPPTTYLHCAIVNLARCIIDQNAANPYEVLDGLNIEDELRDTIREITGKAELKAALEAGDPSRIEAADRALEQAEDEAAEQDDMAAKAARLRQITGE